jgi:hypothetical protein
MSIYAEARKHWPKEWLEFDGEFRAITCRDLEEDPEIQERIAFWERCMKTPITMNEKYRRPCAGTIECDEIDERDLCASIGRDALLLATRCLPTSGVSLSEESLSELPREPAVYWLNCPLDSEFRQYRVVYVGKATDLRHRWCNSEHHRLKQARDHRCRLDWWCVERGTETLLEAALTYHLKPAWNERT